MEVRELCQSQIFLGNWHMSTSHYLGLQSTTKRERFQHKPEKTMLLSTWDLTEDRKLDKVSLMEFQSKKISDENFIN